MGAKKIKKEGWQRKYPTEQANAACDLPLPSARLPQIKIFQRNVQYKALIAQGIGSTVRQHEAVFILN